MYVKKNCLMLLESQIIHKGVTWTWVSNGCYVPIQCIKQDTYKSSFPTATQGNLIQQKYQLNFTAYFQNSNRIQKKCYIKKKKCTFTEFYTICSKDPFKNTNSEEKNVYKFLYTYCVYVICMVLNLGRSWEGLVLIYGNSDNWMGNTKEDFSLTQYTTYRHQYSDVTKGERECNILLKLSYKNVSPK